ncbi:MAG: aldehyde dehydrogenase family protein, partial [Planctomycetota bacterium]
MDILQELGIKAVNSGACGREWIDAPGGEEIVSINPSTGEALAKVIAASPETYDRVVTETEDAFKTWRSV